MDDAYEMINDCIIRLREVDCPRMQKLQVEIGLLRIKRLILALEDGGTSGYCRRQLGLEKFHVNFTRLCCYSEIADRGCKLVAEMTDKLAAVVDAEKVRG